MTRELAELKARQKELESQGLESQKSKRENPYSEGDICYTGFPKQQIVGGNNLNELDGLLCAMFGEDKTVK